MSATVTVEGNVHSEPSQLGSGTSFDFDLGWEGQLANAIPYSLSLTGGAFVVAAPLPAKAVGVRVRSGGPVTLSFSGPAGSGAVQVSERFLLVSPAAALTALQVSGTAELDLLVGG